MTNKITKANKRDNLVSDLKAKSSKNDLQGIWKSIKLAANLPTKSNSQNKSNEHLDANKFNEYFCYIGPKLRSKIPIYDNIHFTDFLTGSHQCKFSAFSEVSNEVIESYIKSLASHKAITDVLPLKIIKNILPIVGPCITHIVNISLSTGIMPDFGKIAQVTPIFKEENPGDYDNYRPTSILPIISKCIEDSVNLQTTDYFEKNNLLSDNQFGFRKNHSTTFLAQDMFDNIFDSKSKGNIPAIIFLDIKKAFDTVDHEILIDKLTFYGVDGTVILWFKNYLQDRKQCTKILGVKSTYLNIYCGVPQGSVLGPLLFSIYINDIVNACNLSKPYLFADDGALLFENICRKTYLNIKIEMLTIIKWLVVNKLSLNIEKTKILIFDNVKFSVKINLGNGYTIEECKSNKYLGLIVDNLLKFDLHIKHIICKIQKRIGAMYIGSSLLPIKYRKMFANGLISPHFDYLDTVYSKANKTKLHELDILYKKVAKIALGVDRTENSMKVYKDMKWLPLHLRRQLHLTSYIMKIIKGQSPSNFINKFKYISGGSREGANCNLYIPKSKSLKQFYYLGARAWNNLPPNLRKIDDPKTFSKEYKLQLLHSITIDTNYIPINSFDNFYKLL